MKLLLFTIFLSQTSATTVLTSCFIAVRLQGAPIHVEIRVADRFHLSESSSVRMDHVYEVGVAWVQLPIVFERRKERQSWI